MKSNIRQRALIGVAAIAILAAVLIAILGSGTHRAHTAAATAARPLTAGDIDVAASYIGVSPPQLRSDLRRGRTLAEIAAASGGRSTSGLLDALVAAKRSQLTADLAAGRLSKQQVGIRLRGLRRRAEVEIRRAHGVSVGSVRYVAVASRYLGLSPKQLHDEHRVGRSLAEIADGRAGKSAAGLIDALLADRRASLQRDVGAGTLSRGAATRVESGLRARVSRQVERKPPKHG
jgi:hypothetical protein